MAAQLGTLTVEVAGQTHVLTLRKIDLVWAERQMQKPAMKIETLSDIYELAWVKLRRMNVEGTPDTFEAWLELDPDVDADFDDGEAAGGKDSGSGQSTG